VLRYYFYLSLHRKRNYFHWSEGVLQQSWRLFLMTFPDFPIIQLHPNKAFYLKKIFKKMISINWLIKKYKKVTQNNLRKASVFKIMNQIKSYSVWNHHWPSSDWLVGSLVPGSVDPYLVPSINAVYTIQSLNSSELKMTLISLTHRC